MKVLIVLLGLMAYASSEEHCYNSVTEECSVGSGEGAGMMENCNAKYGAIQELTVDLQKYANLHIQRSFEYLLMSTHFANFEKSRAGFESLYRKLSDATWNDGIDVMKHLAKRGGKMDFTKHKEMKPIAPFEVDELSSLARALDTQKEIAHDAHLIHGKATRHKDHESVHDPEISAFIEEKFVHKHANTIRELSGHGNDLRQLLNSDTDNNLSLFLFDEYLQKA